MQMSTFLFCFIFTAGFSTTPLLQQSCCFRSLSAFVFIGDTQSFSRHFYLNFLTLSVRTTRLHICDPVSRIHSGPEKIVSISYGAFSSCLWQDGNIFVLKINCFLYYFIFNIIKLIRF